MAMYLYMQDEDGGMRAQWEAEKPLSERLKVTKL